MKKNILNKNFLAGLIAHPEPLTAVIPMSNIKKKRNDVIISDIFIL